MAELNWTTEVVYNFEFDGDSHRELVLVNGIDGMRYVRGIDGDHVIISTTHESTGGDFEELKPELVASRVAFESEYSTDCQLLYLLPDTGKHLLLFHRKEKMSDYPNSFWHTNLLY